jgi:hypothetical protein
MDRKRGIASVLPDAVKQRLSRAFLWAGYEVLNVERKRDVDGLFTFHTARFREDPRFRAAYQRGIQASAGVDPHTEWRVHIGLWAASVAARATGDFVECGVNAGFVSSAIMRYLDWNTLGRRFFLVDTFQGPVAAQYSTEEVGQGRLEIARRLQSDGAYVTDLERIRRNYSEWQGAEVVQGQVPEVLPRVPSKTVAFLHIDMNCAYPEAAALEYFWPMMAERGVILFDDYCYEGYAAQSRAIDRVAAPLGVEIAALPTGQGLIVK